MHFRAVAMECIYYILESFYLAQHTSRNQGPWKLAYHEEYPTRSEAMKRERWLKSGAGRQWLNNKFGRASPPQAD